MPTPPRDSREEEEEEPVLSPGSLREGAEQVLRALGAGTAEPDIITGSETTPAGSNPVSAQATQPEAASVLEGGRTGQAELRAQTGQAQQEEEATAGIQRCWTKLRSTDLLSLPT